MFGTDDALRIEVHWDEDGPFDSAASATRGGLVMVAAGRKLWPAHPEIDGFGWTWVEMLEHLADAWPYLAWEDGFPLGLRPGTVEDLRSQLHVRWEAFPRHRVDHEAEDFDAFLERHDLSRGVMGAILPSLLVVREGNLCWLCHAGGSQLVNFEPVMAALEELGDHIGERLSHVEDGRSQTALHAWKTRNAVDADLRVAISTGLDRDALLTVSGDEPVGKAWELHGVAESDLNELLAVARLAGPVPADELARIIHTVRSIGPVDTAELDALVDAAPKVTGLLAEEAPFEQGYLVAQWLRDQPGVADTSDRVDPDRLLRQWGVQQQEILLRTFTIDAVACWGRRHGPAVLVNSQGQHNRSEGGRNATLAHEIGHLLMDRAGALPLAEVLGGQTTPHVEARARAFAAELLLPREVAGTRMAAARDDPATEVRRLRAQFGVSQELIAWQARNSDIVLPAEVWSLLRDRVSRPDMF